MTDLAIRHTHRTPDDHAISDQTEARYTNLAGTTIDRIQYCTCGRSRLVKTLPDGSIHAYAWT